MINWRQSRQYLFLARRLLTRPRFGIWWNFFKYTRCIGRIRRDGPDVLPYAPPSLVVWVTARCNKKCDFCHYRAGLNEPTAAEMELTCDRFLEIIEHPVAAKALRICLYGGEPLLNADLVPMIRAAKQRGHLVTISTNALLLDKRREELLSEKPDMLSISYYPEDRQKVGQAVKGVSKHIPVRMMYLLSERHLIQ